MTSEAIPLGGWLMANGPAFIISRMTVSADGITILAQQRLGSGARHMGCVATQTMALAGRLMDNAFFTFFSRHIYELEFMTPEAQRCGCPFDHADMIAGMGVMTGAAFAIARRGMRTGDRKFLFFVAMAAETQTALHLSRSKGVGVGGGQMTLLALKGRNGLMDGVLEELCRVARVHIMASSATLLRGIAPVRG